jgi:hypothetical protein
MAKKFFPEDWEKISKEEMVRARARLSGFIESIPDKDKSIRDVSMGKNYGMLDSELSSIQISGKLFVLGETITA